MAQVPTSVLCCLLILELKRFSEPDGAQLQKLERCSSDMQDLEDEEHRERLDENAVRVKRSECLRLSGDVAGNKNKSAV